ncbi:MAG: ATP-dependent helicase/nuclease subunit [Actinomycetota bacterium]|nr:ATP-dependent helicase/nuclease subunit [Actinomycetota bacterium]
MLEPMRQSVGEGSGFLGRLAAVVTNARRLDPTCPVVVIVSTGAEARELRLSMARSSLSCLHVGVSAATVPAAALRVADRVALGGRRLADPVRDVADAVRRNAAAGYFAPLNGRLGVTDALQAAVGVWDQAGADGRARLVAATTPVADHARLTGLDELYRVVCQDLADADVMLPGELLGADIEPGLVADSVWVDATLSVPTPAEGEWLARLGLMVDLHRVDPAALVAQVGDVLAGVSCTVDPVDESMLAARRVTLALESGVAARDIVVAVASSEVDRYASLIAASLACAQVPVDYGFLGGDVGGQVRRLWDTATGRVIAAIADAVSEVRQPADLRMDQLVTVARAAVLRDDRGVQLGDARVREVWQAIRGTDPAGWSTQLLPPEAASEAAMADAAECLREIAAAIHTLATSERSPIPWSDIGSALAAVLARVVPAGLVDDAAAERTVGLLEMWHVRAGNTTWAEALGDLSAVLGTSVATPGDGVRIAGLSAAWAMSARVLVVVGAADDQFPGVQSAVGPLSPGDIQQLRAVSDEVQQFRAPNEEVPGRISEGPAAEDGMRWLIAALAGVRWATVSYPRSDMLRTVTREPSRYLIAAQEAGLLAPETDHFGSRAEQFHRVDDGTLGLLGPADAAASLLRCGTDSDAARQVTGLEVDLSAAVACAHARASGPVEVGAQEPTAQEPVAVDAFDGDLRSVAREYPDRFSPDFRRGPRRASPSSLEKLLGCPAGWWAQRMLGVGGPEDLDPAEMDPRAYGSWLHEALQRLSEDDVLIGGARSDALTGQALWDAVGGRPDALNEGRDSRDTSLWGFRFRLTDSDIARGVADISRVADSLAAFLAAEGGSIGAVEEAELGPGTLELPSGALDLAGRVDRIDDLPAGRILVTDYKTGVTGSGFQLAVYAWLRLLAGDRRSARLLYATTRNSSYRAKDLLSDGTSDYDLSELTDYLSGRLTVPVALVRAGTLPSGAWNREDHDRYCVLCGDLVPASSGYATADRGVRALALKAPAPAPPDQLAPAASVTDLAGTAGSQP